MRVAIAALDPVPEAVVLDAVCVPGLRLPQLPSCTATRCAPPSRRRSIVAKVYRDRLVRDLGRRFPAYGFEQHKGYGTPEHWQALSVNGPCPEHRLSYHGVVAGSGEREFEVPGPRSRSALESPDSRGDRRHPGPPAIRAKISPAMAGARDRLIQSAEKHLSRGRLDQALKDYLDLLKENPSDIVCFEQGGRPVRPDGAPGRRHCPLLEDRGVFLGGRLLPQVDRHLQENQQDRSHPARHLRPAGRALRPPGADAGRPEPLPDRSPSSL